MGVTVSMEFLLDGGRVYGEAIGSTTFQVVMAVWAAWNGKVNGGGHPTADNLKFEAKSPDKVAV